MSVDRLTTSEVARRPTPTEREHELAMTIATRQVRVNGLSVEIGQEARTKDWYVKSLACEKDTTMGWKPWLEMVGQMAATLAAALPQPTPDNLEAKLAESVRVVKEAGSTAPVNRQAKR